MFEVCCVYVFSTLPHPCITVYSVEYIRIQTHIHIRIYTLMVESSNGYTMEWHGVLGFEHVYVKEHFID